MSKKTPLQKFRRKSFRLLLWSLAALALIDLWTETCGLPRWLTRRLCLMVSNETTEIKVGGCYCGVVNGLKLENVTVINDSPLGRISLNNRMIRLRPRLLNLLKSDIVCDQIHAKDTKVDFINANDVLLPPLDINSLTAVRTSSDSLDLDLNMTHAGISANSHIVISSWEKLEAGLKAAMQDESAISPEFCRKFADYSAKYAELLEKLVVTPKDSNLEIFCEFDGAATDFTQGLHVEANFQLDRVRTGAVYLNKCQGTLKYSHGLLYLKNLQWFLLGNEQISLSCSIDLLKHTIAASYSGAFFPVTITSLLTGKRGRLGEILYCTEPISFSGGMEESSWDWKQFKPKLQLNLRNFYLLGTHYHSCTANLSYHDQIIGAQDAMLSLDYLGHHSLAGNLSCNLQDMTLSADMKGTIPLATLLRNAGVPGDTLDLGACNETRLHLSIQESPLTFPGFKGEITLQENDLLIKGLRFQEAKATLQLDGEFCKLSSFALTPKNFNPEMEPLKLSVTTNLLNILENKDAELEFQMTALAAFAKPEAEQSPSTAWQTALDAQGTIRLDLNERQLEMTSCQGTFNLEHLYATYGPVFGLQSDILDVLHDKENQAVFHLQTNTTRLDNLGQIKFHGDIAAQDVLFDKLYFRQATADFQFDKNSFLFHRIDADVNQDEELHLTLEIAYPQLAITITNATIKGDPTLINSFIMDETGLEIYEQIWTDLHWSPQHPPVFDMKHLHYFSGVGYHDWTLDMEGVLHGQEAKYGEFPLDKFTVDIKLELPRSTHVGPCVFFVDGREVDADYQFLFDGVSRCDFTVSDKAGGLDLISLFKTSFPDSTHFVDKLSIAKNTSLVGKGFFEINSNPSFSFSGKLTSPECSYDKYRITDVEGTFDVNNKLLRWNLNKAKFLQGDMLSTGVYDFDAKTVDVVSTVAKLPIQEIAKLFPDNTQDTPMRIPEGNLDAQAHFKLFLDWVGKPTLIEGGGNLNITEGDLWKVPILNGLGKILSIGNFLGFSVLSNLGTISELHSDFSFVGDRILFQNMQTDGTIISLRGNGEYNWSHDQLYFLVIGEALAKSNFLNFILKPFTWYFEAELKGTLEDNHWKPRNQFKKIFFN